MVLIAIRAPLLGLIITILSVIAELAFLTAALTFLRYNICRRLQRKQKVTVRSQHFLILAVTLFAMLAFVAIEAVTSIFSDPQTLRLTEIKPCSQTILGNKQDDAPIQSEAIQFRCTEVNGTTLSHFEGNFSIPTGSITCSDQPAYKYDIGKKIKMKTEGATQRCEGRTCAFAKLDGETLYLTGPAQVVSIEVEFRPTEINPDSVKRLDVGFVATQAAKSYISAISEEGEVRRRALMGSIKGECPFTRDNGSGTTVPLGVIIGAAVVWASSLLFFVASLFIRRRIFFDITHPMHWARKVCRDVYRPLGSEPELESEEVDGERQIVIVGYVPTKDD